MYYYEGSVLPIEWTDQHGCGGNSKVNCEIVLQYACEDTLDPLEDDFLPWVQNKAEVGSAYRGKQHFRAGDYIASPRDGVPRDALDAATDTIPDNELTAIPSSVNNRRYGMHESYDHYQLCQRTERNKGLYTADQRIRRHDKRGTRQNPGGNRRGLECPEERDYYPWWHPSPWVDIAVLTDSANNDGCMSNNVTKCSKRCQYYMENTMNYHKKGYCDVDHATSTVSMKLNDIKWRQRKWYNNNESCVLAGYKWYEISHSDVLNLGDSSFTCAKTQYSRTNQLGNAASGTPVVSQSNTTTPPMLKLKADQGLNANRFLWTIPSLPTAVDPSTHVNVANAYKSCTLRIRYNITSADFPAWPEEANQPGFPQMADYRNNSKTENDPNTPLHQDPYVYMGPGGNDQKEDIFLSLAINTNQYARTFQDRSYVFSIKPLPTTDSPMNHATDAPRVNIDAIKDALRNGGKIYNVGLRGKRGNIVQTFPSVEYDFMPSALALNTNDMIHFQWTGSDYNPRRGCNNGEGGPPDLNNYVTSSRNNARADRTNLVFTHHMGNNVPRSYQGYNMSLQQYLSYAQKTTLSKEAILGFAPCATEGSSSEEQEECYEIVRRLAHLNQQRDGLSLTLRQGKECLSEQALELIRNTNERETHPLNCAKLNAKPFPYFDAGIMFLRKVGWYPFMSTRNNNFSNRQQIGVLCVGNETVTCPVDSTTGVLQDENPLTVRTTSTSSMQEEISSPTTTGLCEDTQGPNSNAVVSCIDTSTNNPNAEEAGIVDVETIAIQEGDNDNTGDGQMLGCDVVYIIPTDIVEDNVSIAVGLLFVGLFTSWLAYYLYNRYNRKDENVSAFRNENSWQSQPIDVGPSNRRPMSFSAMFTRQNPAYSQPQQMDQPLPSYPNSQYSPQAGTDLPRAQGAFSGVQGAPALNAGRDQRPLSSPRGGDKKSTRFAATGAGVSPPVPPTSSIPMVQGAYVNGNTSAYSQQQGGGGGGGGAVNFNRMSSPRAMEFAQARTQVKKPIKMAKASDMI